MQDSFHDIETYPGYQPIDSEAVRTLCRDGWLCQADIFTDDGSCVRVRLSAWLATQFTPEIHDELAKFAIVRAIVKVQAPRMARRFRTFERYAALLLDGAAPEGAQ